MNTKIANTNRIARNAADQHLADGLTKRKHDLTSFMIGGTSHTPDDILIVLQARMAAANLAQSTRATWLSAVKADRDESAKTKTFVSGLRQESPQRAPSVCAHGSHPIRLRSGVAIPLKGSCRRMASRSGHSRRRHRGTAH
jgi:hypothetical protein